MTTQPETRDVRIGIPRRGRGIPGHPSAVEHRRAAAGDQALIDAGKFHGDVLDAGCGEAATALHLAEKGFTTVGLDQSETAIKLAREEAAKRGLTQRQRSRSPTSAPSPATTAGSARSSTQLCSTRCPSNCARATSNRSCGPPRPARRTSCWCSTRRECPPTAPVNAVTEDELRDVVSKYWEIDEIRPARIHAQRARSVRRVLQGVRRHRHARRAQRPQVDRRLAAVGAPPLTRRGTHPIVAARPLWGRIGGSRPGQAPGWRSHARTPKESDGGTHHHQRRRGI